MAAEEMCVLGGTAGKCARDVAVNVPGGWRGPTVAGGGIGGEDDGVGSVVGGLLRA